MNLIFIFLLSSIMLFTQSCQKDSITQPIEDYSNFLNSRQFIFSGTMGDSSFFWKYGVNEFQRGTSTTPSGIYEQSAKSLCFWLTSTRDLTTRIYISTPTYPVGTNYFHRFYQSVKSSYRLKMAAAAHCFLLFKY